MIHVTIVKIADCRNIWRNFTLGFCIRRIKDTELNARMVEGETCHTYSRVELQQLTVVAVPLLTLEPRCHQLSPIRLWLR